MATGPIMAIGAVDMLTTVRAHRAAGGLSGISISKLLIGGVVPGLILSARLRRQSYPRQHRSGARAGVPIEPLLAARYRPLVLVLPLVSIVVVIGAMSASVSRRPRGSAALGAIATMALAPPTAHSAGTPSELRGTVGISGMILSSFSSDNVLADLSFPALASSRRSSTAAFATSPDDALLIFLGIFVDQVSMMLIRCRCSCRSCSGSISI